MQKKDIALLIMAPLLMFVGVFDHSLWTPDEPRVAEIARTMAVTGDYLIPHLAKDPFLEQPPLYYAVTGLFWHIFGTGNEGFGRLSSVFFALGSLLVVFFGMRSLYSSQAAALTSLILATTVGFFTISHRIIVDNALAFFITAALFSFLLAYQGILKKGYPLFWLCLAGAFLIKGFIGLALPGLAVMLFVLWQRDFAVIKRAWVIPGILVVIAVIAAWGVVLYQRGGTAFLYTFFLYNNLGRFLNVGGIYNGGHVQPFYHYLGVIFSDGLPWSLILLPALVFLKRPDERLRIFYCWFFGGLILLSLSSTKRNLYFLPMYPALAAMVAVWIERTAIQGASLWERRWLFGVATMVGLAGLGLPVAYVKIGGSWPAAIFMFLLSMVLLWGFFRSLPFTLSERIVCSWAVLIIAWSTLIFPQLDTLKTYKPFFREAGRIAGKDTVIGYNLNETMQAFSPFYGGFPVENISDRNQFSQIVTTGKAQYVLFQPKKNDMDLSHLLELNGQRLLKIENQEKRPTEFWRLSRPLPAQKG